MRSQPTAYPAAATEHLMLQTLVQGFPETHAAQLQQANELQGLFALRLTELSRPGALTFRSIAQVGMESVALELLQVRMGTVQHVLQRLLSMRPTYGPDISRGRMELSKAKSDLMRAAKNAEPCMYIIKDLLQATINFCQATQTHTPISQQQGTMPILPHDMGCTRVYPTAVPGNMTRLSMLPNFYALSTRTTTGQVPNLGHLSISDKCDVMITGSKVDQKHPLDIPSVSKG